VILEGDAIVELLVLENNLNSFGLEGTGETVIFSVENSE